MTNKAPASPVHSFNRPDLAHQPAEAELTLRKAFYLLVNVEEHPEVLPFAFDFAAGRLEQASSEPGADASAAIDHAQRSAQAQALAANIEERGKAALASLLDPAEAQGENRRRHLLHVYSQYMPMALVDGCWLQNGARVATAHTRVGATITGLYQHQVRAFVADPGRHFVNDYRMAFSRVAGEVEDVSSFSFCERADVSDESFELPVFLLSLAQSTRTHSPEIVGVNLAWQFLQLPAFGLRLIADFCDAHDQPRLDRDLNEPEYVAKGRAMALQAVEALLEEAGPDQEREVWTRMQSGARAAARLWEQWVDITRNAAPKGPPDPRRAMIELMWKKAPHAKGYHGKRPLGDRLLDDHLDPENFNGPRLLDALANSPWVRPGQADKSPLLNHLIGFGGPMLGVFNPGEQHTIRDWINSLPPRESGDSPSGGVHHTPLASGLEMRPAPRRPVTVGGRLWKTEELAALSKEKFAKCGIRELYHQLVNVEYCPEILPVAERFARNRIERSMATMWKGERPIPAARYSPAALDAWVEKKHREQVESYRAPSERPEVPKDAFVEASVQLAPLILIDGGWLQGMASPAIIHTTVGRMLFHVFVEEIGEGNAAEHHANIYRDLLKSMGVSVPAVESREFAYWERLETESFEVPTLWLAISCFPRHFMPEILGLNLAVELAGVGAPYMEARDTLRKFRFPTLFVDVHNAADNVTAGHSAWAVNAIKRFMDELAEREGPHQLDDAWHRIWCGVRATLPQIGPLRLAGHRIKRRVFAPDRRFIPLIFPT